MPIQLAENTSASVPTPPAGSVTIFVDSADGLPKYKDSTGTVSAFSGLTNPMTAVGDLIVGGTAGTPTRVGIGANTYVWTSNGTTGGWAAATSGFANPMTAVGQIIYGGTSGAATALAAGTSGYYLKCNGAAAPSWAAVAGGLGSTVTALTIASGVVNIDCSLGDYFTLTINANVTSLTFSNLPASGTGRTLSVTITQDGTGSRTFALPASFKAITGSDTAIQSAASAVTKLSIESVDAGTTWAYAMKGRA